MKNRKLNVVDIILIIAVVLLIGATVLRQVYAKNTIDGSGKANVEYTVSISGIESVLLENLAVGDVLYTEENEKECGVITKISASYASFTQSDDDGMLAVHTDPTYSDCVLTVRVAAEGTANAFSPDGSKTFGVGDRALFYTSSLSFEGMITHFDINAFSS